MPVSAAALKPVPVESASEKTPLLLIRTSVNPSPLTSPVTGEPSIGLALHVVQVPVVAAPNAGNVLVALPDQVNVVAGRQLPSAPHALTEVSREFPLGVLIS